MEHPHARHTRGGGVCPVFLCDTPAGTKVCRFNDHEIIFRNRYVSELLALNDIPAPQTTVHAYFDCRFETYDYCPTPTLYEQIQSGMINTDVFEAYKQITEIQRRISEIPCEYFKPHKCRHMYEIFTANQKNARSSDAGPYIQGCAQTVFRWWRHTRSAQRFVR